MLRLARSLNVPLGLMTPEELEHWLIVLRSEPVRMDSPAPRQESLGAGFDKFEAPPLCWRSVSDHSPTKKRSWSLLVLVGYPRAGKDTVADYLARTYKGVGRVAFSDGLIAEVNAIFERWSALSAEEEIHNPHQIHEGNKSVPMYRKLLQDWGAFQRRAQGASYWVDKALHAANVKGAAGAELVVMTGARSPQDVQACFENHAAIWRVDRPGFAVPEHELELLLDRVPAGMWDAHLVNLEDNVSAIERQTRLSLIHRKPQGLFIHYLT